MNNKVLLLAVLLIPLTVHAKLDFLLKCSPIPVEHLTEALVFVQDGQNRLSANLSVDENGWFFLRIDQNNYSLVNVNHQLLNLNILNQNQKDSFFKRIDLFKQAFTDIRDSGILVDDPTWINKVESNLEVMCKDEYPPEDLQRLKALRLSYQDIIFRNESSVRKHKIYGATTLAFITASIGAGIYFTYKKITSKPESEKKELKSAQ